MNDWMKNIIEYYRRKNWGSIVAPIKTANKQQKYKINSTVTLTPTPQKKTNISNQEKIFDLEVKK